MLVMPSFKKSLIVEQFQGNYLNSKKETNQDTHCKIKETLLTRDLEPPLNEKSAVKSFTFLVCTLCKLSPLNANSVLPYVIFCFLNLLLILHLKLCMLEHTKRQVKVFFLSRNAFIVPYVNHRNLLFFSLS